MPTLAELKDHKDTLAYRSRQIFQEAMEGGSLDFARVKALDGTTEEKILGWERIEAELNAVSAEYEKMARIESELKAAASGYERGLTPVNAPPFGDTKGFGAPQRGVSLRDMLENNAEFKNMRDRDGNGTARLQLPSAEFKTLISLSGVSPQNTRQSPVNMRLEERTVIDVIGEQPVSTGTVEWYEETTATNAAAETAEGDSKPEATLAWTLRTTTIKTIPVWIPVTKQALADVDFLEGQIRNRLTFFVQRREEQQVLTGNGSGENIRGIVATGSVQTQAKGSDPTPTAVFKALQKVRGAGGSGFADPDLIVMHPNDYTGLMTLQDTTGNFVLQAILQQSPEARLWGIPIRQTTAMTENTALVGAFALGATVYRREGITVTASSEHSTYFTENKVAILAESRIGLAVEIPTAFCLVTGI